MDDGAASCERGVAKVSELSARFGAHAHGAACDARRGMRAWSLPPRRTGALPGVPTVGRVARVDYAHLAVAFDAVVTRSAIHFGFTLLPSLARS